MILANCTVDILRGTYKDEFGDSAETDEPVHTNVPMSITEVGSNETTMAEGMPRQVRFLVGRAAAGTDVRHEDRLRDTRTGFIYLVDGIDETAASAILDQGIRLELRRTS